MNRRRHHIVIDGRIRRTSTGRYVDRLIEHLQALDDFNRYTILLQPDDPWKPTAKNFSTVACPYPQFSVNPLSELKFTTQLYSLKPDLVHFTMTQQPLLYFGKIVTTSHDTTMYRFVRRGSTPLPLYKLKIGLYAFLVWWGHRKSAKVIIPTRTVAKEFAEMQPFVADKLVVTLEASEPPLSVPAVRPDSVHPNERFIMYVGTAFPHKNLPTLIKAFNIICKQDPDLKLVIVGKHEKHYFELIEWAKTQPSYDRIIFTGFIADEALKWLYTHCRAYVFASLSEGFGLPPLEAMSHGAPVVSSDSSVMPEVYGDAAHYCKGGDPKDIARAVSEVIDNEILRKDLIKRGHERLKKFSWRHMADQTLIVYKDVLGDTTKE